MRVNDRIIHIGLDEKFINHAMVQFEGAFPKQNQFYIRTKDLKTPLKFVEKDVFVKQVRKQDIDQLAKTIDKNQCVVLHSLPEVFVDFVLLLPKAIPVLWLCYGFEVYNNPNFYDVRKLLAEKTIGYLEDIELPRPLSSLDRYLSQILPKRFLGAQVERFLKMNKALERINYLGTSFDEEYQNIKKLTKQSYSLIPYWHYPLENILDVNLPPLEHRPCLLIGNSAAASNNHLDVFDILKTKSLSLIDKVVIPLNYGDNGMAEKVNREAFKQFDTKYSPIKNFMSLEAYNEILKTCGIAIFYSARQQAIGTTIALLWFGAKVYLSELNPFFQFLKRVGIEVFSVEKDLKLANKLSFLDLETIKSNRALLKTLLSQHILQDNLKKDLMEIFKD